MKIGEALSVGDITAMARRRLPRLLFDTIESGVEDEIGLARNEAAFRERRFLPRYLVDVARREQSTTLFGRRYASPFGIAPTGVAGLFRHGADSMLAQAAAESDIPFVMSGASFAAIEDIARTAPEHAWFQVYAARDPKISESHIVRARDAGMGALILTVDNPVSPKRERDMRNGFAVPFRPRPSMIADALAHPGWLLDYLSNGGTPVMANWAPHTGERPSAAEVFAFFRTQSPSIQTWRELELFRRLWPRTLIVKGILHPDDAVRAADAGVDGIIVSNHGSKSLDRAPATLEALPAIHAAVGHRLSVMLDSGIRRGSDILIARCLGARFCFVGRATLYGVAAAGQAGAQRAIDILREEIDTTLALIGCPTFDQLGPEFLMSGG